MGGRVAYFFVDAMRFEMGVELARQLEGTKDLTIRPRYRGPCRQSRRWVWQRFCRVHPRVSRLSRERGSSAQASRAQPCLTSVSGSSS